MTDVDTGTQDPAAEGGKPNFSGKWVLDRDDGHFEDYLRENGAPWIARKAAAKLTPTQNIEQDGDKFKISIVTFIFTTLLDFTVGDEFKDKGHGGVALMVQSSWDGDKLVLKYTPEESGGKIKEQTALREIVNGELKQTMTVGDVTTVRYFKRQA